MLTNHNTKYVYEKKLKIEVEKEREREKILVEIIFNSILALSEVMKKKKRKKRSAIWIKNWLEKKRKREHTTSY